MADSEGARKEEQEGATDSQEGRITMGMYARRGITGLATIGMIAGLVAVRIAAESISGSDALGSLAGAIFPEPVTALARSVNPSVPKATTEAAIELAAVCEEVPDAQDESEAPVIPPRVAMGEIEVLECAAPAAGEGTTSAPEAPEASATVSGRLRTMTFRVVVASRGGEEMGPLPDVRPSARIPHEPPRLRDAILKRDGFRSDWPRMKSFSPRG